jgi:hypothetical protein
VSGPREARIIKFTTKAGLLLACAIGLTGCSSGQDTAQQSQTPVATVTSIEPTWSPTTSVTPPEPEPTYTAAETAYLATQTVWDDAGSAAEQSAMSLESGYDYCETVTGYRGDELAAYLIEEGPIQWDEPAIRYLCRSASAGLAAAKRGISDGESVVVRKVTDDLRQVTPGTYETLPGARDCYWARLTRSGKIIRNDFVEFAAGPIRVTIKASDGGFKSDGCTAWIRRR